MNPFLLKQGFSVAREIYKRVNEYRDEQRRNAYDALQNATDNFDADELRKRGKNLLDESRREAGKLTQAAHNRLDQAREEFANRAQDASKQVEKRANAAADRLSGKKAKRDKRRQALKQAAGTTGILALVAAIAAAVYYFVLGPGKPRKDEPSTKPPRVEEHSGEKESNLVYSTTTGEESSAGPLGEEPAERDETLLGSIDEQLQKLKGDDEADKAEDAEDAELVDEPIADADFTDEAEGEDTTDQPELNELRDEDIEATGEAVQAEYDKNYGNYGKHAKED